MTKKQIKDIEEWGQSKDGYLSGGIYEENPNLKLFTVKKYEKQRLLGELAKIPRLDDNSDGRGQLNQSDKPH